MVDLTDAERCALAEPIAIMQALGVEGDGIAMRALCEIVEQIVEDRLTATPVP